MNSSSAVAGHQEDTCLVATLIVRIIRGAPLDLPAALQVDGVPLLSGIGGPEIRYVVPLAVVAIILTDAVPIDVLVDVNGTAD